MKHLLLPVVFAAFALPLHAADPVAQKKIYECRYLENPPFGVTAWSQSDMVKTGTGRESRFVPYNSEAAKGLVLDATALRKIEEDTKLAGRDTSFYMVYDSKGWYIYIQCDEPNLQTLADQGKDLSLELFFCPGLQNVPYHQMIIKQIGNSVTHYDWDSPHRHYRSLKGRIRLESTPIKSGVATFLFIPWDALYDRLPLNGDTWRFSFMRWNPAVTWGGNVHDTGNFGLVRFQKPPAGVADATSERLVHQAWHRFRRVAEDESRRWNDELLGDPAFFRDALKPVLDSYAAFGAGPGMWDVETARQAVRHLADWMEFPRTVADLRERYLRQGHTGPPAKEELGNPLFATYEVPAISPIKRLPDSLSSDARPGSHLSLVAAQGEFEPVSFVIAPKKDVSKLTLKATPLQGPAGSIPADHLDIKVVKCWYQGGTAWYSYFADNNRRELVPELLLNDETLVKVDAEKQENHLRVGNDYTWISYPKDQAKTFFNYLTEPVADSKTLQPVTLRKGENKQFWITLKVPEDCPEGIYRGTIELFADGTRVGAVTLAVKVLPFTLPRPKTYYDVEKDYLVTIYGTGILEMCRRLGIAPEIADAQQKAIYRNLLEHNVFNCRSDVQYSINRKTQKNNAEELVRELRLMKEAGFAMKPLLSRGMMWQSPSLGDGNLGEFKQRMTESIKVLADELGHRDIYLTSWDEAGRDRVLTMRNLSEVVKAQGASIWVSTAPGVHFDLAGYVIGYANHGGWPTREIAATWHAVGAKVASYAGPHTGPENPDVFRRWEGLARYKSNYDGSFNYKYFSALHDSLYERQKANVWNDFNNSSFRNFNMVYPTKNGMIDTIAWEGFREGIDDVRYATRLKLDAAKAIATGKLEAANTAKKALMWLELLDDRSADLNSVRLEMIGHILKIRKAMAE